MISKFALFGTFLLASSALVVHASQPGAPLDHCDQNYDQLQSLCRVESRGIIDPFKTKWTHNLAGSVLTGYSERFNFVTATFTIPTLTGSDGTALISMGIDAGNCYTGSLMIGIQGNIASNVVSWSAFSRWIPHSRITFKNAHMKAADVIKVTIHAYSSTKGSVIWVNKTTGKVDLHYYDTDHPICMETVGWGVQAVSDGYGDLVTLANFGTVNFTNAMVTAVNSSHTYFPSGPSRYNIYGISQNAVCLASVTGSGSFLVVKHA